MPQKIWKKKQRRDFFLLTFYFFLFLLYLFLKSFNSPSAAKALFIFFKLSWEVLLSFAIKEILEKEEYEWQPSHEYSYTPKTPLTTNPHYYTPTSPQEEPFQSFPENKRVLRQKIINSPTDNRIEKLISIIKSNPWEFGVSENGKILYNLQQPMEASDIRASLNRLLNRNVDNAPSPPGTTYIERKLRKNPETLKIIETKNQFGTGVFKKFNKTKKICNSNHLIKPKLWNKNAKQKKKTLW